MDHYCERVFDDAGRVVRRPVDPPQEVLVDLAALVPPRLGWGRCTPLWVRAAGLRLEPAPGLLHEWLLTATGSWAARVELHLHLDGRPLRLQQLVPAAALRPAAPG